MYFIFLLATLISNFSIENRFEKTNVGDYMLLEAGKTVTLLTVRSKNDSTVVLEEISAPSDKRPANVAEWVKARAPNHTSWSMTEIDLKTGDVLECYSFSKSAWISADESVIAALIRLPLMKIEEENLRKIGPAPQGDEPDRRKIWTPPFAYEGQEMVVSFDAYKAEWPQDGTELAGKDVSLYFDSKGLAALPFWIQVDASLGSAAVKTLDAGKNLPTIYRGIPRRAPEIVGPISSKTITLRAPRFYKNFELFAIDVTGERKEIVPVDCEVNRNGEIVVLEIAEDEALSNEHKYKWLVQSQDTQVASNQVFTWKGQ